MKLQTWEAHHSKAYDHIYILRARQLIPIERSRAVIDQRGPTPTLLWMRRWANTILTGITLRQYRSLLYEFPSGNLVGGLPLVAHTGEDSIGPAPHP